MEAQARLALTQTQAAVAAEVQELVRPVLRVQGLLVVMAATQTYRVPLREIHWVAEVPRVVTNSLMATVQNLAGVVEQAEQMRPHLATE